ncbi:iron ABC transporter permease [Hyperthermus butylicus]|uniref:ABC-type transport n=1 Tax=Hyperthermus butylicus (strain DSM 5456 / JCM 9403 / PLM1-5) TaxID=415426 RepID=A2BJ83_HYPBU|nr:iron ABC transporter permease [Hyperthermus butylicus]ABM80044.1 putative ABC-type transport [Hyperthermus butylicus DSM 5456]
MASFLPLTITLLLFPLLILASLAVGPAGLVNPLDPGSQLIARLRLMRTLLAVGVGTALGLSGTLVQYSVANPLASPSILGVSAGALAAASAAYIVYRGSPPPAAPLAAAVMGGLAAYALTLAIASRAGLTRVSMVLAGIAVSSSLAGIASMLVIYINARYHVASALLLMGSFAYAVEEKVLVAAVAALVAAATALILANPLDALSYGDETALSLGYSPAKIRLAATAAAVAATAATVYAAGLIGFADLVAANIARSIAGSHPSRSAPASALIGAEIALAADIAGRLAATTIRLGEIPAGLLTSTVGGLFLAFLVARKAGQGW